MKNAITQEFLWNSTGRNGQVCRAINISSTELTLFRARVWWALFWKTPGSDKAGEHRRPGKYQNIIICFGDTLLFFMSCKNILEIPAALCCRSACLWQRESAWGSFAKGVGDGSAWATLVASYFNGIVYPVLRVTVKPLREQFVTTTFQSSHMYHQDPKHTHCGHKTNW